MKNKFDQLYNKIIKEQKFKGKKWKFDILYKNIEIYQSFNHIKERLLNRYKIDILNWANWATIKVAIIDYLLSMNEWDTCTKNPPFQKLFVCHLTTSNMYITLTIQNDLIDNVKRIYFSTVLPLNPTLDKSVQVFDLPL